MEESLRVEKWIKERPENEELLLFMKKIWDISSEREAFRDIDSAWARFNRQFKLESAEANEKTPKSATPKRAKQKNRNVHWMSWVSVAAAFVIIGLVTVYTIDTESVGAQTEMVQEVELREINTVKGQRSRLRLSDGSTVQLNAESRLSVPEYFKEGSPREVYLEGEAYFEIIHDPDRQFIVYTDNAISKVLGTKFSVKSYPDENQISVAVSEGRVSIENRADSTGLVKTISENQLGVLNEQGIPSVTTLLDLAEYLGWTTGKLVFNQDPLSEVKRKLERWYDIDIQLKMDSEGSVQNNLTATFSDGQPIEDVLESISLVMNISFEITDSSTNEFTFYNN